PDVLRHVRRDRPVVGPGLHRRPDRRRDRRGTDDPAAVPGADARPGGGGRHAPRGGPGHCRPGRGPSGPRAGRPVAPQASHAGKGQVMHIVAIGGSDAGISAALRAREVDPDAEVTVVVADAYPNFSICGIPYYVSGEVTHWRNLAHRTYADLEAAGMRLRLDTIARKIDVAGHRLAVRAPDGNESLIDYYQLIVGTGAVP